MTETAEATAQLEQLAVVLKARGWHAEVQRALGRRPVLHVRNPRVSRMSDDVITDGSAYQWKWGQDIGPISEVAGVADRIQYVLREVES